jgi:hypothetical protein
LEQGLQHFGYISLKETTMATWTEKDQRSDAKPNRPHFRKSSRTGNPNATLEQRSLEEIKSLASQLEIPQRSKMSKQELINAIRNKRRE